MSERAADDQPEAAADPPTSSADQILGSTLIVAAGFGATFVTGFIQERVVGTFFGTSAQLDAYFAANTPAELLVVALAGGALNFAFIPIYTSLLNLESRTDANDLFSQVMNAIFILTAIGSLLVALFANTLVTAPWGLGAGFDPATQVLTIQVLRILLLSTMIFSVSGLLSGALHANQHFLLPALAPAVYNAGIVLGAWLLSPTMGVFGLAWGAVLGALLHLAVQLPGMLIYKIRWSFKLNLHDTRLHRVAILMAPRVVDLLLARLSLQWINVNIATGLGEGRVSALRFGRTLMNLPWTLIGTAIGIAIFPTLAALAARNDLESQRRALNGSLRAILTLALPAAVGLVVLGRPAISLIYEGGEFGAESAQLVYIALQFWTVALISQSVLEVVVRAFAAQEDTYTPLYISFFTTALNVGLAFWLASTRLEHGGLALANGIAVGVEALIGLTILHLRWQGFGAGQVLIDLLKASLAAGVMAAVVVLFQTLLPLGTLPTLLGGGLIGVGVYFGVALLLGIREVLTIPASLVQRFLSRAKKATNSV
ncbi:MAG: murein biosynthesis integral membrane protein MurJ [Chloroflexi bacterium]|nr:murein biosynthesis integral membrane protein MurJ [Chloroflexota bacterium]